MGSGHILAYLFDVLMQIYTAAGYSKRDAAASIVEHNLYGLDIDDRAAQMAYFVVMMKGCQYDSRFLRRHLNPHVYAIQESGELPQTAFGYCGPEEPTARTLWDTFRNAKEYGSILQPKVTLEELDKLEARLQEADSMAGYGSLGVQGLTYQLLDVMYQLIDQARMLVQKYDVVVTNPPYMGGSGMNARLSDYVKKYYPDSKSDLFAVFIERCAQMDKRGGYQAMITQHAWMFLSSFEQMRKNLIANEQIVSLAHLGVGTFEDLNSKVVQSVAFILRSGAVKGYIGNYNRLFEKQGLYEDNTIKADWLVTGKHRFDAKQDNFSKIPGSPVAYWVSKQFISAFEKGTPLGDIANVPKGLSTGSVDKFMRFWYEVSHDNISFDVSNCDETLNRDEKWYPYAKGGAYRKWSGNQEYVVNWGENGWEVKHFVDDNGKQRSRPQNTSYYFHECLTYSAITSYKLSLRYLNHAIFGGGGDSIHIRDKKLFEYVFGFINSELQYRILSVISPTINFEVDHLKKLPIIIDNEKVETVNAIVERLIRCSQNDWDSFETSWDFKRHPLI